MHIADLGARDAAALLSSRPRRTRLPGLVCAMPRTTAPPGEPLLPPRRFGRVGLLAAWEDETALEAFLADHAAARRLSPGWQVRLEPLRVSGAWAGLEGLAARPLAVGGSEAGGGL